MKLFALSDLHLSLSAPHLPGGADQPCLYKPMEKFGLLWADYFRRLEDSWREKVAPEDAVLIAGDVSWGLTLDDALFDLDYIEALPGKKILVKGNHDYWWQSLSRVREAAGSSLLFLQHSAFGVGPWAVCGTRGWLLPSHADFKQEEDGRLLHRELLRLEMALEEAAALERPIIVMLHYPPLDDPKQDSPFTELIGRYPAVTDCVYGHIHGDKAPAFEGVYRGVRYQNCSIDRLDFTPRLIAEE
ncbi:MAG: metallophosphoesterase [Firmicutes bacterium]|nr:metallophosphoesterase [Bacillota bacterium]